jgi:hypothetical protein
MEIANASPRGDDFNCLKGTDNLEIVVHITYCTFAFARMNSSTSFFSRACAFLSM